MVQIDITIDNIVRTFSVDRDYSLSWAIYQEIPSALQIPTHISYQTPLWILINDLHLANADITSIFTFHNSHIITVQYALNHEYFNTLLNYLIESKINLQIDNVALILFSLHIWTCTPQTNIKQQILLLMEHFPRYITQPESIYQSYLLAYKDIKSLKIMFSSFTTQNKRKQ